MKRFLVMVLLFIVISFLFSHTSFLLTDKEQIIRETLRRARQLPGAQGKSIFYVSSENIGFSRVPRRLGEEIRFIVMSSRDLKKKANKGGDFLYLSFQEIVISRNSGYVNIHNNWMVADDSPHIYVSGGELGIEFEKRPEGWIGRIVMRGIS